MIDVTNALQDEIGTLARQAGALILEIRASGLNPQSKQDNTPVTEADKAADRLISGYLKKYGIPIVSEEGGALPDPATLPEYFWLVDPLDGTRGFIRGGSNFTVNIALIRDKRPIFGVIFSPVQQELYTGVGGSGAYVERQGARTDIHISRNETQSALISSHHCKNENAILETVFSGIAISPKSSSIKFCKVAEGEASLYFRMGETSEWDTGAGQAILEAAGGKVLSYPSGEPFLYTKPNYLNSGVIAGHPAMVDAVIAYSKQREAS